MQFRFPAITVDEEGHETFADNVDPARVRAARAELPTAVFEQEYLCEFGEAGAVCFKEVEKHLDSAAAAECLGPYVIGVDWGFAHDYTAACVMDLSTGRTVAFHRSRQVSSQAMCREIAELAKTYDHAFCLCDVTSLQDQALGALRAAGAWAEGFVFSAQSKTDMIEHLLMAWEHDRIKILPYAPLMEELKIFEARYTPATRQRSYGAAPGVEHHDDCVMALGLAWWGRTYYPGNVNLGPAMEFKPVDWEAMFL